MEPTLLKTCTEHSPMRASIFSHQAEGLALHKTLATLAISGNYSLILFVGDQ